MRLKQDSEYMWKLPVNYCVEVSYWNTMSYYNPPELEPPSGYHWKMVFKSQSYENLE